MHTTIGDIVLVKVCKPHECEYICLPHTHMVSDIVHLCAPSVTLCDLKKTLNIHNVRLTLLPVLLSEKYSNLGCEKTGR